MIDNASIYVLFSTFLFLIGLGGFIRAKSSIRMLIAIEIMLNSANINFAIFALYNDDITGIIAVIIGIALAAAEAAVGLGIILSVFRNHGTVDITDFTELKG